MLYHLFRPLLFKLDAEKAHHLTLDALKATALVTPQKSLTDTAVTVCGISFSNQVGLAAGLDKNADYFNELGKLGFGFIEVGTVTPVAQLGNPKPRLFRLPEQSAIINRMGFNNAGIDALVNNVKSRQYQGVLGINIGKNKATANEDALSDYLIGLEKAYPYADYIAINISSPNTEGLRDLQATESIKNLIFGLKEKQQQLSDTFGYKPILVKIAPDLEDKAIIAIAKVFNELQVDGVIATNTTIDKRAVATATHGQEEGGLSGAPLTKQSTHVIKVLASELNSDIDIIGVGGIMNGQDAVAKINAGAKLVQVYSGLIYQGPKLVDDIRQTLQQATKGM